MVTIRRHPVAHRFIRPQATFERSARGPTRTLQAHREKPSFRGSQHGPCRASLEDREGVDRFITAITGIHVSRKKAAPRLVAKPPAASSP